MALRKRLLSIVDGVRAGGECLSSLGKTKQSENRDTAGDWEGEITTDVIFEEVSGL